MKKLYVITTFIILGATALIGSDTHARRCLCVCGDGGPYGNILGEKGSREDCVTACEEDNQTILRCTEIYD